MDDSTLLAIAVVLAPGMAFVYWQLFVHASYHMHMLRRIDQSAVETQTTETTTPVK